MNKLEYGRAICYSGYRTGQNPIDKIYPSYEEIKEDLLILEKHFDYIRMYDPSKHAEMVLDVIRKENISLKVMLGIDLLGEISNHNCAWGGQYSEPQIVNNIEHNEKQLRKLIELANINEDIIISVSAGNEATPEWNDNLVSPERVLYFVRELKKNTNQLVTYCENVNYWNTLLNEVANEVDIISIHTYPVWVGKTIHEAFGESLGDYYRVANHYRHKQCIITEAGWPTRSNGRGISPDCANEDFQVKYIEDMKKWSEENQIVTFFFEAFDEPWKGNALLDEPEKHWGIYFVNRTPKKVYSF